LVGGATDLPGLREGLADASLVELLALEGRVLAVTLIGGRARLHDLAATEDVAVEQAYLRSGLRRLLAGAGRGSATSAARAVAATAARLDQILIAPLGLPDGPVVIVPTGALHDAAWEVFGDTDPDNAPVARLAVDSAVAAISVGHTGAGTTPPFVITMDAVQVFYMHTNGRVGMNTAVDNGAQLNVNGYVTRISGAFRAHRNSVAFNVNPTTFTKINFTTEEFDEAGWFDTATDRFTPQMPGKYMLCAGCGPDVVVPAGKRHETLLYKNGVVHRLMNNQHTSGATGSTACGAAVVSANGSTDYFEVYVWHDFAGVTSFTGLPIDCYFEGAHLG
jgi:hypothetical protein